ncbi:MAG TPA: protein translocase subunit SecF [Candidatus Paceibacterota bacterium]|nr:protein translocase subunit SecF [Candidatus Paceibacterota bacterium]
MFVIRYKIFFIGLSIAFVAIALTAVAIYGVPLGIDFKGGSQLQVTYASAVPTPAHIQSLLLHTSIPDATVQPTGDTGMIIKSPSITDAQKNDVMAALSEGGTVAVTQESFTTIGPSVGIELKHKAIISTILVLVAIILFVAYAFRKVSYPVSSWKYGGAVIIALVHDIAIPLGAFALLGHFYGAELDTLFVVALLTTLALSVADTIVVFDRIREHLGADDKHHLPFTTVVGESLRETFARSINTSLMVLVMVVTLAIVGPASTKLFATVLSIGMFFGTYSSIFLASPLLVVFEHAQKRKEKK